MLLSDLYETLNHSTMEVYHFTSSEGMRSILDQDEISVGASRHELGGKTLDGVSTTRNPLFDIANTYAVSGKKPWRIGLDYRALRNNFKVIPIRDEYLRNRPRGVRATIFRTSTDEMEEFVLSDIKPLSRFITSIAFEDSAVDLTIHPNDIANDPDYYENDFDYDVDDNHLAMDILANVDMKNFRKIYNHPRHGIYKPHRFSSLRPVPFLVIDRDSGRSMPVIDFYKMHFHPKTVKAA